MPAPTESAPPEHAFDIKTDLEFKSAADADRVDFKPMTPASTPDKVRSPVGGVLRLDGVSLAGLILKEEVKPGSLVHFRTRAGESGPCYSTMLAYSPDEKHTKIFCLGSCPHDAPTAEVYFDRDDQGDMVFSELPSTAGTSPGIVGSWTDMVFWLPPENDRLVYIIGDLEKESITLSGSVALPADWQSESWTAGLNPFFEQRSGDPELQYIDVDFIRLAEGSALDYLMQNMPADQANREKFGRLLKSQPGAFPELRSTDLGGKYFNISRLDL